MRSLVENIISAVFALILALFVWVAAVREQNPMVRGLLSEPVPIEVANKPSGLEFVNPSQVKEYVQVIVRAPQSSWDDLKGTSFQAKIDLGGMSEGSHDVEVQVQCADPLVRIEEVQPSRLTIRLEPVTERVLEVKIRIMDDPALGYEARTATVTPPTVKVIGPASKVNEVQSVVADVYLKRAKATVERDVIVTARDAQDNLVSLLRSIEPSQVVVTVPIEQKLGYRDVSVSVIRKGQVARGYRITGITVDPSIVTLVGSPLAVSELPGYVDTLPVDINGATSDIKAGVGLVLPQGVSILGEQVVSVTVSVAPIIDSITVRRTVSIQGLNPGFTATTSPDTVDVIISGPVPKLEALSLEDVRVVVDLFGLAPGIHKFAPHAFTPEGLTAESVLPETVEVEIKSPIGFVTPSAPHTPTPGPTLTPTPSPTPTRRP